MQMMVLFVGGLAAFAIIGVLAGRKILHGKVQEGHNDVVVPIFLTAGVIYAVLLGFMVVAVWESYGSAKANAANEAAALVPLYRATSGMPKEAGEKMRHLAREYAEAVIKDEWPEQAAHGKSAPSARRAIGDMFRAFGDGTISQEDKKNYPFIFQTFMQSVRDVTNMRNQRNIQANEHLPGVMWMAAIGGAMIIIAMCFMLYMEKMLPHVIMASVMSGLIGMLLYVCMVMSHPFSGPMAIEPEAFENTLLTFDDIDKGN